MPDYIISPAYRTVTFSRTPRLSYPDEDVAMPYPTKSISGYVYDTGGVGKANADVFLYRQRDNAFVAKTLSGVGGVYLFPRDMNDAQTYFVVAFTVQDGVIQVHGTSNRGLQPT